MLLAQDTDDKDAFFIKNIYNTALSEGRCYAWLEHLTTKIGGRLSGSDQAEKAVKYTQQMLDTLGMKTWLEPCMVPKWVRGKKEVAKIVYPSQAVKTLNCTALGNSVGTPPKGITAEVIQLKSLDDLETLGEKRIKGKIVFFNRPMDPTQIRTFNAYGGAVDQRVYGPTKAAAYGAVAVVVRSMTTRLDDVPHTGVTVYEEENEKIPGFAISTNDAEILGKLLDKKQTVELYLKSDCKKLPDVQSYSVVGEIKGSEFPDEIILVGGHLDSWDIGQGAHDDGAGCVHAMEVPHIFKRLNYKPKRTLRVVLFMNEENGLGGGRSYAAASEAKEEYHMAALESDSGGFTPRGFSCTADESVFKGKYKQLTSWAPLLEPYGLSLTTGGSGADINPLKSQKGLLIGFRPDSQRYFDYHHTDIDTFDAVNKRELELGAASITALIYLMDKYGVE